MKIYKLKNSKIYQPFLLGGFLLLGGFVLLLTTHRFAIFLFFFPFILFLLGNLNSRLEIIKITDLQIKIKKTILSKPILIKKEDYLRYSLNKTFLVIRHKKNNKVKKIKLFIGMLEKEDLEEFINYLNSLKQ